MQTKEWEERRTRIEKMEVRCREEKKVNRRGRSGKKEGCREKNGVVDEEERRNRRGKRRRRRRRRRRGRKEDVEERRQRIKRVTVQCPR